MARPKSEDKRNTILDAAPRVFAERGPTAEPTSEISKQAGVAEGTLLTDFKTNDDLMNALLPGDQVRTGAMMSDLPQKESVRRLRHVWYNCVNWGGTNRDAVEGHILRADLPMELISKMLAAMAEATMALIVLKPARAQNYRVVGFEIDCLGIARK